jgi:hypothetical protein
LLEALRLGEGINLFSEEVPEGRYVFIILYVIINIYNYDNSEKEEGGGRRKTMSYCSNTRMFRLFAQ